MERLQVNVRLTPELIEAIDQRRIALQPSLGRIPTRSEVIRDVLEASLSAEPPRRSQPKTGKRKP